MNYEVKTMAKPKRISPYKTIYKNDNPETEAYGWIQHKGTDLCMDIHCICGVLGHVDTMFTYVVYCAECGREYAVGANVRLILLDTPELKEASNAVGHEMVEFGDD